MLDLRRRAAVEGIGTAILVATVVGSGIMAERLAQGNVALALLCNTIATAGALLALIASLGPLSGAHFNPIITLSEAIRGSRPLRELAPYLLFQFGGGIAGAMVANLMFGNPAVFFSHHDRSGFKQLLGETVATFGLVLIVFTCARVQMTAVPFAVAGYITAAYWFTSSTSFANPAVTLARALSDSFAGIAPTSVPGFVLAECVGAGIAVVMLAWLFDKQAATLSEPMGEPSRTSEPSVNEREPARSGNLH